MKISTFFFLCFLFCFNTFSQGGKGTYIWPEYSAPDIPEEFQNEPAFYLNNIRTIDFMDENGSQLVVFKRIYINSESAADKFNKMEIYIGKDGFVSVLAGRTIKANGDIILLSNDQIIETISHKKNKYGDQLVRRAQFLFPNVEIGDVLDIAYQVDYNHYLYSKLMYLEDDLPSMESKINLRNSSKLQLSIFPLNDMPAMDRKPINGIPSVSWKKNNVSALKTDFFNALPPDHPSFAYMLWKSGESFDYEIIYEIDEGNYPYNFNKSQSITKYFISNGIIAGTEDILVQVQKIIQYFEKELSWNHSENTQYTSQSFDFLKREKVDYVLFYRYISKFLTENKVQFEKGYTKSLLDGKFELDIISLEQIADRFLFITDKNGGSHFLFPPSRAGSFYYLDEIPFYIEENQAICLSGKRGLLSEQFGIKIPGSKPETNRHRAYVSMQTIPDKANALLVDRKDVLGGQYSYLTRSSNGQVWLDELGIVTNEKELIPLSVDQNYPYKANFMQAGDTLELLSQINDTLFWLDLQSLSPKGIYESEELTMQMGNYLVLPFKKENQITFYLNHKKNVSLSENESTISFSNEIGYVSAEAKQMSPTSLMFEIKIQIKERYIRGNEQVDALKNLFDQYSAIRQKKWIVFLEN